MPCRLLLPRLAVLALLALAHVVPLRAEAPEGTWWQAGDARMRVIGHTTPDQVAAIADALARARHVFTSLLPAGEAGGTAPLVVFVFRDEASATAFRPLFEGRAVEVGGAYLPGDDQHVITVTAGGAEPPWRTLHHELSHFVAQHAWPGLPAWFDEGLAEFHATLAPGAGGGPRTLGAPIAAHLRLLARTPLLPMADLLVVTRESPLYNEGEQRDLFYAQSWLAVHYLLAGNRDRAAQVPAYLRAVAAGEPVADAVDRAFAATPAVLDKELADYLKRGEFPAVRVNDVAAPRGAGAGAEALSPAAADAWLAELLLRLGRTHEARARLERALGLEPMHARALSALGELAWREQQPGEARSLLSRAAALAPGDAVVQLRWGRALASQLPAAADAAARRDDLQALARAARRILAAAGAGRRAHDTARAWLTAVERAPDGGR